MPKKPNLSGLKAAIEKAGSQTKLAQQAGCGQQTLSDILHGRRNLTVGIALKIAKAARVSPHSIHPDLPHVTIGKGAAA